LPHPLPLLLQLAVPHLLPLKKPLPKRKRKKTTALALKV
jgi:hypothetical protein